MLRSQSCSRSREGLGQSWELRSCCVANHEDACLSVKDTLEVLVAELVEGSF